MNCGYVIALRFVNPLFCIISTFSTHYMYKECVPFRNVQHEYPNLTEVSLIREFCHAWTYNVYEICPNCTMFYIYFKITSACGIIL